MNWYKIDYFVDKGDKFFLTNARMKAESPEEAVTDLNAWYSKQAKRLQVRKPKIKIFEITTGKSEDENALDILWLMHRNIYLELWEPGITTRKMVSKLKKKYPEIWSEIS